MNPVAVPIDSGTAVGPYVVERRLAQGGMSVLYVARSADGGRVVLKMVAPELATAAARTRLLREARALALVDHPGVVKVHGTGEHHGSDNRRPKTSTRRRPAEIRFRSTPPHEQRP